MKSYYYPLSFCEFARRTWKTTLGRLGAKCIALLLYSSVAFVFFLVNYK